MAKHPSLPESGAGQSLDETLTAAEALISDPANEERIEALARLAESMGDADTAKEISETGKRIRSQLRIALVGFKRGAAGQDLGMLESAKQSVLECMAQESALPVLLSKAISASMYLLEDQTEARLHRFTFEAPSYLNSLVSGIKSEMKAKTGKPVQDYQAIRAAILFSLIHADEFLSSAVVVGPSSALAHRGTRTRAGKHEGGI